MRRIADGPLALERLGAQMEHGATRSIAEALDHEAEVIVATTGSRDHEEGVRAFLKDRDPEFTGR